MRRIVWASALAALVAVPTIHGQSADGRVVVLTCAGDPLVVVAAQSSDSSPEIALGAACAQAVSDVLAQAPSDPDLRWEVSSVAVGDKLGKERLTYTLAEVHRGPQGHRGYPGTWARMAS